MQNNLEIKFLCQEKIAIDQRTKNLIGQYKVFEK